MALKVIELARLVNGELIGEGDPEISSVASPLEAGPDQVAFIADASGAKTAAASRAGCLIVPRGSDFGLDGPSIAVASPKAAFARIGAELHPKQTRPAGVHSSAAVAADAKIGEGAYVGALSNIGDGSVVGRNTHILSGAKIGDGVLIGEDCTIHANAVIEDGCTIGSRVIVKAGAVIGSMGFGFVRDRDELIKFPQVGTVVIEDEVEIGAGTCVDRGALGETRIGRGTKIDNLVQVAHNVRIGERCVIAALTGISGSAVIGDDCVIGGQVGFADHTIIESGAVIGAKSAVFPGKKVRKGVWAGIPVMPLGDYKRLHAHVRSLPGIRAEVKELKGLVKRLEDLMSKRGE